MKWFGIFALPLSLVGTPIFVEGQSSQPWRLAPPDFEVGGFSADPAHELASLGGVTVLDNGNVVIGERMAPFLRVFAPNGDFIRNLGRHGQGPGRYEYIYEMDWCAPGELSAFDVDRRVHRYTGDMAFLSTERVSLDAIGGGVGYNRDCHPNGFQIVTGWGDVQAQFKVGLFEATAPVALLRGTEIGVPLPRLGEPLVSLPAVQGLGLDSGGGPPTPTSTESEDT